MEIQKNCSSNERELESLNFKKSYSIHLLRLVLVLFFSSSGLNVSLAANESALIEVNEEEAPVAISIGGFCHLALALRHHDIRKEAYPFDWVLTPPQSLIKVINEDFYNFFSLPHMCGVINTYTGMTFLHDFPSIKVAFYPLETGLINEENLSLPGNEDEYVWNYKKYMRRIERFKNVLSSNKKVILLRSPATKEEAIIMRDLFINKYPLLNFTLVVINHDADVPYESWNEERILNYYIPQEKNTDYFGPEWIQMFLDTKLIKPIP